MPHIAFLLDNDFEDSEFRVPFDRLRELGHRLTIVGKKADEELRGKKGQEVVKTEKHPGEVTADDFDALVIPGGYSPDHLRTQTPIVDLTRAMVEGGKPVAAICHAGSLLVEANVVRSRRVTSWPSIKTDLENAGARWENEAVVQDENLITSRHPGDLEEFCNVLVEKLGEGGVQPAPEVQRSRT